MALSENSAEDEARLSELKVQLIAKKKQLLLKCVGE